MAKLRDIRDELTLVSDLSALLKTYEELAVMRMQHTRDSVLVTRDFMEGMTAVFSDVRTSYRQKMEQVLKKKRRKDTIKTLLSPGGAVKDTRVAVFLSADQRLAGSITRDVWRAFQDDVQEHPGDIVIVGKVGRDLFEAAYKDVAYTYFELGDHGALVEHILPYDNVEIWYGQFVNLVQQRAQNSELVSEMGNQAHGEHKKAYMGEDGEKLYFLFEPEVEEVIEFFNRQIFSSLVLQSSHESELALLGSRAKAMEEATEGLKGRRKQLAQQQRLAIRRLKGRKQRERLAGLTLWS